MSTSEPSSSCSSAVIPWGQRTRSAARLREQQVMFQVLDNPSLREEIIKHVIIGGDKEVDQRSACALRRVDKSWNESVLKILWKVHQPLYKVVPGDGGNLDDFTKTFASSLSISDPPPPLKLERLSRLTLEVDLERFSNFMTSCGPSLLQLGAIIYDFGGPLPVDLQPWFLPRLHKLEILVALRRRALLASGEQPEAEVTAGQEKIPVRLIKSIFLGATALAELCLSVDQWSCGDPADVTMLDSITFPPTLVKLKLQIVLNPQQSKEFVNALLKNPLPKVTSLTFNMWNDVFADGILFSLMDKWKSSLKNLVIIGGEYEGPPRSVSTIRFPVMEQLEELSMSSVTLELESGLGSLERCFPKMRTLRLRYQSVGMLRKWTESSRFSKVTSLELTLADGSFNPDDDDDFLVGVSMEAMQLVNLTFPNLRQLGLGISKSDASGLRYVFQEMRQLVTLNLKMLGDPSDRTTDVWDSILTGVPVEMMASIRGRDPGTLENAEELVAITNLKELRSFSIEDDIAFFIREYDLNGRSLISDFIFDHAFLQMPQLKYLHFEGPFKVSEQMTEQWMSEEGRSLVYKRFSNSELE